MRICVGPRRLSPIKAKLFSEQPTDDDALMAPYARGWRLHDVGDAPIG